MFLTVAIRLCLVFRLRIFGTIYPLPHTSSWACKIIKLCNNFNFTFIYKYLTTN